LLQTNVCRMYVCDITQSLLTLKKWGKMLRLMLQSGLYYKKLFLNSKSAAYKQERLQIESGL
jgi:hypothetical protein